MATQHRFLHHLDQVEDSCPSNTRHGCSKAQMCLLKILHLISSHTLFEASTETVVNRRNEELKERTGLGIDLNATFCSWPENSQESESTERSVVENKALEISDEQAKDSVQVLTGEKSSEYKMKESRISDQRSAKICEIDDNGIDVTDANDVKGDNGKELECPGSAGAEGGKMTPFPEKESRKRDCLSMLVDAAQLIGGQDGEDESDAEKLITVSASRLGSKRSKYCVVDWEGSGIDDKSLVGRSRRGRSQVLPSRFRDSVLEPWKHLPAHRNPPCSSTTKRRSR